MFHCRVIGCCWLLVAAVLAGTTDTANAGGEQSEKLVLWYEQPALQWTEALPVGNGRLGAMVFGGRRQQEHKSFSVDERIQFNEDTFWTGQPYSPNRSGAWQHLDKARELVFQEKVVEAHQLIARELMAKPLHQMAYQPVGDLRIEFPETYSGQASEYRRQLDLDTAVSSVTYSMGAAQFRREVFSTIDDQVIVVHITADRPSKIRFVASLESPHRKAAVSSNADGQIAFTVQAPGKHGIKGGLRCCSLLKVIAQGGSLSSEGNAIEVSGADSATLFLAADTNHVSFKDISGQPEEAVARQIEKVSKKTYHEILRDHIKTYQSQFHRVQIELGNTDTGQSPTDQRIANFNNAADPDLAELYFQFARYLLISSSQPGCQPANLQGLWNDNLNPPWQSKYTCNINLEMNYWPAEPLGLSECHEPLFTLIEELSESGEDTAREYYRAPGWVCHHNTDLWRAAAPIDGPTWGMWSTGGAWLCQHLWYRYEYTQDSEFLQNSFPIMKGAAEFFVHSLVEDPRTGYLVTCPSISPEMRRFRDDRVKEGISVCAGPTMDNQLLRDLFTHCVRAGEILDIDSDFREELKLILNRLPPMRIGEAGQLQEWQDDFDMKAPELTHRHVSHLYGLYPSDQITEWHTPKLFQAAKKTLEIRGDSGTGWSKAWKINLWARLNEGDRAARLLESLISTGTYPNMFDAHPPFQIDGNFGGANGIAEMLVQSFLQYKNDHQTALIHILPALPSAWPDGRITGVRTRGGMEVDLSWRQGHLHQITLHSSTGIPFELLYRGTRHKMEVEKGSDLTLVKSDFE